VKVIARAGTLRIEGHSDARDVRVRGTARASSRSLLDDIRLVAEERGSTILIEADIPEHDRSDWEGDHLQALDLVIDLPSDLALEVEDGSGDLEIRNVGALDLRDGSGEATIEHVGGNLTVSDGSGEVRITDVKGDVDVEDGSGELEIRDVTGGVDVGRKGSGELHVANVGRSVHVGSKGSGSVDVRHVGGDFIVDNKASGSIDYSDVKGRVEVPSPVRRGRRIR
jgi:DUF4097 and DUF4098 domain-containing protein YvlB